MFEIEMRAQEYSKIKRTQLKPTNGRDLKATKFLLFSCRTKTIKSNGTGGSSKLFMSLGSNSACSNWLATFMKTCNVYETSNLY